jgi:hypothetical protein
MAIRLVAEFVFRPHFMTPLTVQAGCRPPTGCSSAGITFSPQATGHIGDWVLGTNGCGLTHQTADRFRPFQFHRGRHLLGPRRRHDLAAAPARLLEA